MPIVDNELIGEGSYGKFQIPNVPLGIFIETSIRKNVGAHGNSNWLVSLTFFYLLIIHSKFVVPYYVVPSIRSDTKVRVRREFGNSTQS